MKKTERQVHKIDAAGQAPGRLATQISVLLQGKNKAGYVPYLDLGDSVVVENAGKMKFTGRKLDQKEYIHHTTYPGHLKRVKMKEVFEKNPELVLHRAVRLMLPDNKLRNDRLKRLIIKI